MADPGQAETGTPPPTGAETATPKTEKSAEQKVELGDAVRSLMSAKAKDVLTTEPDGRVIRPTDGDPQKGALWMYQRTQEDDPNVTFSKDHPINLSFNYQGQPIREARLYSAKAEPDQDGKPQDSVSTYWVDENDEWITGPDGKAVELPLTRRALGDLTLKAYGEDLTGLFDGEEKANLEEHVENVEESTKTPPEVIITPLDEVNDYMEHRVRAELDKKAAALDKSLSSIPSERRTTEQAKQVQEITDQLTQVNNALALVDSAAKLDGESLFGILGKQAAIKNLAGMGDTLKLTNTMNALDSLGQGLNKSANDARLQVITDLEANGTTLTEAQKKIILEKTTTPEGVMELVNAEQDDAKLYEEIKDLSGLSESLLGDMKGPEIDNLVNSIEATLSEEQKDKLAKLKTFGKVAGISTGLLALLMLGLVGGGVAMLVKGGQNAGR